jgi:phenylacetate-CoA ligase
VSASARPGGFSWPSFLDPGTALDVSLAGLDTTQFAAPATLAEGRQQQRLALLRHAVAQVPFHRRLADGAGALLPGATFEQHWMSLPLMTKLDLRAAARNLLARRIPPSHLPVTPVQTSGSTGIAVEVLSTAATRHAWNALTLREHRWHRRDARGRLGVTRYLAPERRRPDGTDMPTWGNPVATLGPTGAASVIHIGYPIPALAGWLRRFDPHVLLTYPSVLAELLDAVADPPAALGEVRCMAEPLDPALERRVRRQWGIACSDVYSANEVGVIAFRCPEHGRLHVQEENLHVEILDEAGAPCGVGATGRVVVTDLHNLALPLIRYELGDLATVGAPCDCGRGLAVIDAVRGRVRNLAIAPDGQRYWPVALGRIWAVRAVRQAQYVQIARDRIEIRVVVDRPLDADERATVAAKACEALGHPYAIEVIEVTAIERGPTGKFEEFLQRIEGP